MEKYEYVENQRKQLLANHSNLIFKLLHTQTDKIINKHEKINQLNPMNLGQSYQNFISQFFHQVQLTHTSMIINNFEQLSKTPRKFMQQLTDIFKVAFRYINKIIAANINQIYSLGINKNQQTNQTFMTSSKSICRKCQAEINSKEIQYQKINIVYSQFEDPYNLFAIGMTQFQQTGMQKHSNQNYLNGNESQQHQAKIEGHVESIKKRIFKRANQLTEILNQFQKYYLDIATKQCQIKRTQQRIFYKTFDGCLREVLDLFSEKIQNLIDKFRIVRQKKLANNIDAEVQVDTVSIQIQKSAGQIEKLQQQVDYKKQQIFRIYDQKAQLSIKIAQLKTQIDQLQKKVQKVEQKNDKKTKYLQNENKKLLNKIQRRQQEFSQLLQKIKQQKKLENQHNKQNAHKSEQNTNNNGKNNRNRVSNKQNDKNNKSNKNKKSIIKGSKKSINKNSNEIQEMYTNNIENDMVNLYDNDSKQQFVDYVETTNNMGSTFNNMSSTLKNMNTSKKNKYRRKSRNHTRNPSISLEQKQNNIKSKQIKQISISQHNNQIFDELQCQPNKKQHNKVSLSQFSNHISHKNNQKEQQSDLIINETISQEPKQQNQDLNPDQLEHQNCDKHNQMNGQKQVLPIIYKSQTKIKRIVQSRNIINRGHNFNIQHKKSKIQYIPRKNQRASADVKPRQSFTAIQNIRNQRRDMTYRQQFQQISDAIPKNNISPNKTYFFGSKNTKQNNHYIGRNKIFHKTLENAIFQRNKFSQTFNSSLNQQYAMTMNYDVLPKKLLSQKTQELFTVHDIQNLYFSVQGALQHEKYRNKNHRQIQQNIPRIKITMKLLTILASLHSTNQQLYEIVKNFITIPFQSTISQQNYIVISKSGYNQVRLKECLNKILWLHRTCPGQVCQHLQCFVSKLESLLHNQ